MELPTISMPKDDARSQLKAYRAALHKRADAEYEQVAAAYQELARGRAILNLAEAFALAPLDEQGRPRLCIARADKPQARINRRWAGDTGVVCTTRLRYGRGTRHRMADITVPMAPGSVFPHGYALVPLVPPAVKKHYALAKCAVLWEVEQWADSEIGAKPDIDPVLLRHLTGDLWAVLGEWNLTDVERAVMAGRSL